MLDRIKEKVLEQVKNGSDDYIRGIEGDIYYALYQTQLPPVYQLEYIDRTELPAKLTKLLKDVPTLITYRDSVLVSLKDYKEGGFISAACMEDYVTKQILSDEHINRLLYIDTNLLIEDFKKLMDKDNDTPSPRLEHDIDVLYKWLYEADFIFWDKFDMPITSFANSKLYEILSIRYRNCLGNMFFIKVKPNEFTTKASEELLNVMNLNKAYDLVVEQAKYIHKK